MSRITTPERAPSRLVKAARGHGFGRNPLRRTTDRIEAGVVLVALVAGLIAILPAVLAGLASYHSAAATAAERRGETYAVQATLLRDAPTSIMSASEGYSPMTVRAEWTDRDGVRHTGKIAAAPGAQAGSEVTTWVDSEGDIAAEPQSSSETVVVGISIGALILFGTWLTLFLLVHGARAVLDRARLRAWEREWELVAPRW